MKKMFACLTLILLLASCVKAPDILLRDPPALPQIFESDVKITTPDSNYTARLYCLTYDSVSLEFLSPDTVKGFIVSYSGGDYQSRLSGLSAETPLSGFRAGAVGPSVIEAVRSLLYSNTAKTVQTDGAVEYSQNTDAIKYTARQNAETGALITLTIHDSNIICEFM